LYRVVGKRQTTYSLGLRAIAASDLARAVVAEKVRNSDNCGQGVSQHDTKKKCSSQRKPTSCDVQLGALVEQLKVEQSIGDLSKHAICTKQTILTKDAVKNIRDKTTGYATGVAALGLRSILSAPVVVAAGQLGILAAS
jgi:hypothetical protein